MDTDADIKTKPLVSICSYCEQINDPQMARYANGIDDVIKKELAIVQQQVKANREKYRFSHGICALHFKQNLMGSGMTAEKIEMYVRKKAETALTPSETCADLIHDSALRHAYMRGLFTPEEIKVAAQNQKETNESIIGRFQTLSGIKNCYE